MRREKAPDNFSQCRKCGARIIFVRMKSGKSMPVNPNFVNFRRDGGKDRIVLANGEVTSGTIGNRSWGSPGVRLCITFCNMRIRTDIQEK